MRKLILAAALGAVSLSAIPAQAQIYGRTNSAYRHDVRYAREDCRRAMRHADNRWEYRRARDFCRDIRQARGTRWWDGNHWRYH